MSRALVAGADTALQAEHISQIIFLEMQFASGTVRACTREHDVVWNGFTWLGAGLVGSIEPLEEGGDLQAHGVAMSLSAIPAALISIALTPSEYKGRNVKLWFGQLDYSSAAAVAVVANPVGPFILKMDQLTFQLGGETAALRLTAESRLADWMRPRVRRYNSADHQMQHPGDLFFESVEKQIEVVHRW